MELANGEHNKFFSLDHSEDNRYYIEKFDAELTKGTNNVFMLVEKIEENSTVLDIGCAQGNFGRELAKKKCRIFGVDLNEKAIEQADATGYYEKTFLVDVTNINSKEYIDMSNYIDKVDYIIISDVFEHVSDPTRLLIESSKFLKENGSLLISVPNVAHMDILLHLMNDKFNYQDIGILDNTHLKFFTKTSFIDWIEQINNEIEGIKFDCEYIGATFYNNTYINDIKDKYNELFEILENSQNYNALQILFKLTKIPVKNEPMKLNELKGNEQKDVVKILGEAIKGKCDFQQNHKLVEGERLWYEQQLDILKNGIDWHNENKAKMEEYISELQKGIAWHNQNKAKMEEYIGELQKGIAWHNENKIKMEKYIGELQKGIAWHNENKIKMEKYIEDKLSEVEEIRKKEKEEILNLRKRLFEIENSRSWRWTKIFRRGK